MGLLKRRGCHVTRRDKTIGEEENPEVKNAHAECMTRQLVRVPLNFAIVTTRPARIWQVDEGYLTDKNTLPVTALKFNAKGKRSDFTVGPLECWGGLDKHKISMIQPQQSGMSE